MFINDPTFLLVLFGVSLFGFVAGIIGTFALLTRQSLLADTISHAALPGIGIAFLLTHTVNPFILLIGGIVSGAIGAFLALSICWMTPLKNDAALGFVLSAFFGLGLVILTVIQKKHIAQQSLLNKFLFGSAATLLPLDVWCIIAGSCFIICCLLIWWRPIVIVTFDSLFAASIGMHVKQWQFFLTFLLVLVIVLGLQTVGVVLMSTLCIAPAAAVRQWTNRCDLLVIASGIVGASCSAIATVISSWGTHIPTGPTVVIIATVVVGVSLLCAPSRGLLWHYGWFTLKQDQ